MFNNTLEKIIPIRNGDYLKFVHHDKDGQVTVETFARVQNIDISRSMATICYPDNVYFDKMNTEEKPIKPPFVRGTVSFSSQYNMVDGIDFYFPIKDTEVPGDIKCRLNHQP